MGTLAWADPRADGPPIVDTLPSGPGRLQMIDGAGDDLDGQRRDRVGALILVFLRSAARA
jgi:hypothetical protein